MSLMHKLKSGTVAYYIFGEPNVTQNFVFGIICDHPSPPHSIQKL